MKKTPRVIKMYWMDEEEKKRIKKITRGKTGILYVFTKDYDAGEEIQIKFKIKEEKQESLSGTVDANGLAKIKWTYLITNNENS